MEAPKSVQAYYAAQKRLDKAKEDLKLHERGLRVAAALVFREVYDVGVGDVYLWCEQTELLVLGFDWVGSLFDADPRPPVLMIVARKLDGEWSKLLKKQQFEPTTMVKRGTELEAAEELRLRV